LIGAQPHFDNINYLQRTDAESLISTDFEREQNLDKINRRATDSDAASTYASGNRSNLLFVETCLEHIDQNLNLVSATV